MRYLIPLALIHCSAAMDGAPWSNLRSMYPTSFPDQNFVEVKCLLEGKIWLIWFKIWFLFPCCDNHKFIIDTMSLCCFEECNDSGDDVQSARDWVWPGLAAKILGRLCQALSRPKGNTRWHPETCPKQEVFKGKQAIHGLNLNYSQFAGLFSGWRNMWKNSLRSNNFIWQVVCIFAGCAQ